MDEIKLRLVGETSLITHNNRLANPLDKYSQAIGLKSGKRKKTIDDIWELARIEWEGGMYLVDGKIKIPMRVLNKVMERGATKQKNGQLWKTGCILNSDFSELNYSGKTINVTENGEVPNSNLDEWFKDKNYYQAMVRVGQSTILRTRPIFHDWVIDFSITFDANVMNGAAIIQAANDAGRLVGLCEWRPERGGNFGRFRVEVVGRKS